MNCPISTPTVRVQRQAPPHDAQVMRSIPDDFPGPDLRSFGAALTAVYEYRNEDDSLAMLVARIEQDGKKTIRPCTVNKYSDGCKEWHFKTLSDERPLYRLPQLLEAPVKPVLISEGEKCADAAALFSDYASVTWSGGSNALAKTDFAPLAGRDVIILPDHDEAGRKAASDLGAILTNVGAASIHVVDIGRLAEACDMTPEKGFDIADAVENGLNAERFAQILALPGILGPDMVASIAPLADDLPDDSVQREVQERFGIAPTDISGPFALTVDGVLKRDFDRSGRPTDIYAGSPLVVLGRTRTDRSGQGWGYSIALLGPSGDWVTRVIPARLLAGDGRELRELLADAGATLPQTRAGRQAQSEYIGYAQHGPIKTVADRPGWHGDSFVLPHHVIHPAGSEDDIIVDMSERQHYLSQAGSIEGWRKLPELAEYNSRVAFATCAALAASLLALLNLPGGGFHFFGRSSLNKTGTLIVAGSVWGGGGNDGFVRSWRMTDNGAEGMFANHNDLLLPLDELTMVPPEMAADLYYMLGNGHGKARAAKDGTARAVSQSRVMVLSSGENTAEHQIGAGRGKTRMTGGLSVRMPDIPIEHSPGESLEDLCGFASPGQLAEEMTRIGRSHHGHAGPAFIASIIDRKAETIGTAERLIETFVAEHVAHDDDPQIRRVATRFGLVAAAGQLAVSAGILPWHEASPQKAAASCFAAWKSYRGGGTSQEERDALAQIKAFFEASGRSRFERLRKSENTDPDACAERTSDFPIRDQCGYRIETEADGTLYYVTPEAFRREICGDHSPDLVIKIARQHGALVTGEGGRPQKKVRLPGYSNSTRVYALRPDLLP